MNIVDRQAIEDLFARVRDAERTGDPRDPEAEALIGREIARQPAAPYYLAQTVLVQQWALNAAQDRIRELEAGGAGGFLSRIFGTPARRATRPAPATEAGLPRDGFLAGATPVALAIAGGFLLHDMAAGGAFENSARAAFGGPVEANPTVPDCGFGEAGGDFGGGDG